MRFDQEDYNFETAVVKESVITYYEIPSRPVNTIFEVQKTALSRDENLFMSLSGITSSEETFFLSLKRNN